MFGIYYANKGIQYNYMYDETVAAKGTDEVNSLLHHFIKRIILPGGYQKLTIYADNCGGQNKNSFVVRMLLALTHMRELESVELKFFVKGHTKTAVDRGFGHVRKHLARRMDQLLEAVNDDSTTSALVHVPKVNDIFKEYRNVVGNAYKKLKDIQKFQIFSMHEGKPGVEKYDGIPTDGTRVRVLFDTDLHSLSNPLPNAEKIQTIYNKIRRYVPEEFRNDPLYDPPNEEEEMKAKAIQKERAAKRKTGAAKKKHEQAIVKEREYQIAEAMEVEQKEAERRKRRLGVMGMLLLRSLPPRRGSGPTKQVRKTNVDKIC